MSDKLALLQQKLINVLVRHIEPLFVSGMKFAIIARNPNNNEMDVLMTDDNIDELIALLERSRTRPEVGAAKEGGS